LPTEPSRPRVLMVAGDKTFHREWIAAARVVADVVHLQFKPRLEWEPLIGNRMLGVDPSDPLRFEAARSRLPHNRLTRALIDRLRARQIADLIRHLSEQGRPVDLIHGHFYASCSPLPIVRRRLGIPYIVTEHSTKLAGNPYRSVSSIGERRARRVYADASSVVAVSDTLRRAIVDRNLASQVEVIPNPIDVEVFRPQVRQKRMTSTIRCLNVGRMHPIKGQDTLLEAFARASAQDPRLTLDVIGAGRESDRLEALQRRLGLAGKLRFLGGRDSTYIAEALNDSDVFILSSRYETFGVPVAEALATGTPVVATAAGAVPELVTDQEGRVVPVDDVEALAGAILEVSGRLTHYAPERIAARAHERFGRPAVADRLGALYQEAIGRAR